MQGVESAVPGAGVWLCGVLVFWIAVVRLPALPRSQSVSGVPDLDQQAAATLVRRLGGGDDTRSLDRFLRDMQSDKPARDALVDRLRRHAIHPVTPPWRIVPVLAGDIDDYL